MQKPTDFFCPNCNAKLVTKQIDIKFHPEPFVVLRNNIDVTINNAISGRKFPSDPPDLRQLATDIATKIFENHPDLNRIELIWVVCPYCNLTTFVTPDIREQIPLHAILSDSDGYDQVLTDYEQARKSSSGRGRTALGLLMLIGIICGAILVGLFVFILIFILILWVLNQIFTTFLASFITFFPFL
ncbi:MAG: hypothetical protein ACFFBD_15505 [Candidatus Hodarchaeota archaeon]